MGHGDQLMATGMARGARLRGKRIAFGDGKRIIFDQHSEIIFRGNPNIARPGQEKLRDIEWIRFHKGHRVYNRQSEDGSRWLWNEDFRPIPGEVFLSPSEIAGGKRYGSGYVVIEPGVVNWKSVAVNKDWGFARYQVVVDRLREAGYRVNQFQYGAGPRLLKGVQAMPTDSFRGALMNMKYAGLYVGPEGGLHHAAAAFGVKGVVIFGGFIPPSVTGYDFHINLTGGAEACGSLKPCAHCRMALDAIEPEKVAGHAVELLRAA